MRFHAPSLLSQAIPALVVASLVTVALAGCESATPPAAAPEAVEAAGQPAVAQGFWRRPRTHRDAGVGTTPEAAVPVPPIPSPPPSASAPTNGASGGFDCTICTRARDCCDAVAGGPLCTFSAATCSGLSPTEQGSYVQNCVALIRLTIDAWASSAKAPPAVCTLK